MPKLLIDWRSYDGRIEDGAIVMKEAEAARFINDLPVGWNLAAATIAVLSGRPTGGVPRLEIRTESGACFRARIDPSWDGWEHPQDDVRIPIRAI